MKDKTEEHIIFVAMVFALLVLGVPYFYKTFFIPQNDNKVTFEVIGITNSTNATTLVQIHFECIKWCTRQVSYEYFQNCWKECASLGKEGCPE